MNNSQIFNRLKITLKIFELRQRELIKQEKNSLKPVTVIKNINFEMIYRKKQNIFKYLLKLLLKLK